MTKTTNLIATVLLSLLPLLGCGEGVSPDPFEPAEEVPAPTAPPCFGDLPAAQVTLQPNADGSALTRTQFSEPAMQLHVDRMTGPQHLSVSAASLDALPDNELECLASSVRLEVRVQHAASCQHEVTQRYGSWDGASCAIADAALAIDGDDIDELRVIARAAARQAAGDRPGRVEVTIAPRAAE